MSNLPDVQKEEPKHRIAINQVGVSDVKVPMRLRTKFGHIYDIAARVTMTTNLHEDTRGISMSRFIRTLEGGFLDSPLNNPLIKEILEKFQKVMDGDTFSSLIKFEFDLPYYKTAPVSGLNFPEYFPCWFCGVLDKDNFRFFEGVKVQYASYCPCSASLCNYGETGYPHAQRSFADVSVEVALPSLLWLEDIIELIEQSVVTVTYPIVLRSDERDIGEKAKTSPQFVEDAIRAIDYKLSKEPRLKDYYIRCVHEESIHKSTAVAALWLKDETTFERIVKI